jgi:hypothetical protein
MYTQRARILTTGGSPEPKPQGDLQPAANLSIFRHNKEM